MTVDRGKNKFAEFHDKDPKKIGNFASGLKIPSQIYRVGTIKRTDYASYKWGEYAYYTHDHGAGVYLHLPDDEFGGRVVQVPKWLQKEQVLVKLGHCLEVEYDDGMFEFSPRPELYCTPCGRALLLIANKKELEAIIWGGKLAVEARGIVY